MLTKTNGLHRGKYLFQPTRYNENNNLFCALYKNTSRRQKCKLTLLYKFEEGTYEIIWVASGWLSHAHKKLLTWFLKQYEWI